MSAPSDPKSIEYDAAYFSSFGGLPYSREEPYWLWFFGQIADRIVQDFAPRTVLDAGCAMGFLVEALRDRGVEAFGFDISEYALSQVRKDIAPFTWQASAVDPLASDYDVIVCIEVLEHLPANDIEPAIDNFCGHTKEVLFSSTPDDFREPTHFNVRPTSYWVGAFARRGFLPDVGYDGSFITQWTRRFQLQKEPIWRTLESYERTVGLLENEAQELRAELLSRSQAKADSPPVHRLRARLQRVRRWSRSSLALVAREARASRRRPA
jgi:SAM-dependent methyltransferase